ncbi:sidestep protein-like protein, partial [Dinothrombium tinctorium]
IPAKVVLVNTNVALPCNITPLISDDSVLLIFWYHNEKTIYTLDSRVNKTEHFANSEYSTRVTFEKRSPVSYLLIQPAIEEDEGEYRCRVDFKLSSTRNTVIPLQII